MATAIAVRNLLGEMGEADVPTLAQRLGASKALLEALLERLLAMGVVEKVAAEPAACGCCKGCAEATRCATTGYRLSRHDRATPLRWISSS
ncbi:FeoC-like transcriptional regulator [Pseudomonas nicosulfuronedens]|uniref:Transcriptional regulator n=1 Tax=Pseudomonas nicosulfuronedens TaxID=2571105 RepID=A0A5R9R7B8_9PSED|nr:FeoC-like transcriptional regulator [Pseudomonas nicosulfuronedens]MDH1009681.1 FeoC-like transcriptional regulator [Pseudomonas nicosulfuronedens]MDH1980980.1 FeoC-like transcriptional regulator [Pseudomonas nicosulfuronedens]MDH2027759.1 FeoC-like transcriptional regulator [Pseudomonas nicosulfuronedens]TLX78661.1 transcriptional regulator [Pseudomonas nicosulfuronedens]